jgi:hypothetical protein
MTTSAVPRGPLGALSQIHGLVLATLCAAPIAGCGGTLDDQPGDAGRSALDGDRSVVDGARSSERSDSAVDPADDGAVAVDDATAIDAPRPEPVCGDGRCAGEETTSSCAADCAPCRALPSDATALERALVEMPADSWYEAPGTPMRAVCPPASLGLGGCQNVIDAWSGGAFDAARSQMIVWGGGHGDYRGNELYAFDVRSGTWSLLTEPSVGDILDRDPLPDGQPVSRHTYEGIEMITHADVLFSNGGSRANDGNGTAVTWTFDFETSAWTDRAPVALHRSNELEHATAYDPESGLVLQRDTGGLHTYDIETNTWSTLVTFGEPPLWPRYAGSGSRTAAIDPVRRVFWAIGSGDVLVWDIAAGEMATEAWRTTGAGAYSDAEDVVGRPEQLFESGGGEVFGAPGPGLDYDAAADQLVAWANAGGPYVLDLESREWTRGSGEGAPTSATSGGTFGRWRYIAAYNVFILVVGVDQNVFFYKNTRCAT